MFDTLASCLLLVLVGCCAHHPVRAVRVRAVPDLLFGSECVASCLQDTARGDWPSTDGITNSGEQIDYEETIIDLQGRGFGSRDGLYRRFDSVRTGRGVR